jgi:hypothetical protein
MAKRRMINLRVVDTDDFLDMPQTTQLLYYNLAMRADDDGFVANPKRIMRMTGGNDDDYKVLIAKRYIIPFQSGVCVIRHWRIHNLIRSDRYIETDCLKEKNSLLLENGKYEPKGLLDKPNVIPNVIPNGNQMEPQVRLGKVRLGKDNIYMSYKNKINSKSILTSNGKKNIQNCLRKFSESQLLKAIDNKSKDSWFMRHNSNRGITWFFSSLTRIARYIEEEPNKESSNVIS